MKYVTKTKRRNKFCWTWPNCPFHTHTHTGARRFLWKMTDFHAHFPTSIVHYSIGLDLWRHYLFICAYNKTSAVCIRFKNQIGLNLDGKNDERLWWRGLRWEVQFSLGWLDLNKDSVFRIVMLRKCIYEFEK